MGRHVWHTYWINQAAFLLRLPPQAERQPVPQYGLASLSAGGIFEEYPGKSVGVCRDPLTKEYIASLHKPLIVVIPGIRTHTWSKRHVCNHTWRTKERSKA